MLQLVRKGILLSIMLVIAIVFILTFLLYSSNALGRPLILSKDPDFLKFRSELSPKIEECLRKEKLTPEQNDILQYHKEDLVDIFVMNAWNTTQGIPQGVVSHVAQKIESLTGKSLEGVTRSVRNGLAGLQAYLQMYKNATKLDLSGFHLSRIPARALMFFDQLHRINLSSTKLKGGIESLEALPNLRTLHLENNDISKFPDFSGLVHLKTVVLDSNPIENIDLLEYKMANGMFRTTNITQLSLKNIKIVKIDNINEVFPDLKYLILTEECVEEVPKLKNGIVMFA